MGVWTESLQPLVEYDFSTNASCLGYSVSRESSVFYHC